LKLGERWEMFANFIKSLVIFFICLVVAKALGIIDFHHPLLKEIYSHVSAQLIKLSHYITNASGK